MLASLSTHFQRRVIAVAVGVAVMAGGAACARPVLPRPIPAEPIPPVAAPVPSAAPSVVMRYAIPALVTDSRYQVQSIATLERDSTGHRDTQKLTSNAQVVVRIRRRLGGGFDATGRLYGYTVQSALSTTPVAIDSLRFDAVLDSLALRVAMQPPLVNECDRPESGALSLVRDLLIRVPASLSVGDRWRDSTVGLVCRANLPMVVRTIADYVVIDTAHNSEDGVLLVIRRTSNAHVEGKLSSPWRSVEVTGVGTATLDALVSVRSGAVRRVHSTSTLTLTATDRTTPSAVRTQQVTQRVTLTGVPIGS